MNSPKVWIAAFFIFTAIGASKEDACLNALKSLETKIMQRFTKLEADVKAISCGPNLPGKIALITSLLPLFESMARTG